MHMGALPPPPPPMAPASTTRFRDAFAAAKKQYGPVPGGPGSPHQQRPFLRSVLICLTLTNLPHNAWFWPPPSAVVTCTGVAKRVLRVNYFSLNLPEKFSQSGANSFGGPCRSSPTAVYTLQPIVFLICPNLTIGA